MTLALYSIILIQTNTWVTLYQSGVHCLYRPVDSAATNHSTVALSCHLSPNTLILISVIFYTYLHLFLLYWFSHWGPIKVCLIFPVVQFSLSVIFSYGRYDMLSVTKRNHWMSFQILAEHFKTVWPCLCSMDVYNALSSIVPRFSHCLILLST